MAGFSPRIVASVKKTQTRGRDAAPRGASGNGLAPADRWRGELANHRLTLIQSLRDMVVEPLQTAMTVLVIAIALALPGALYLAVENLERLSGNVEASTQITVFVEMSASQTVIAALDGQL